MTAWTRGLLLLACLLPVALSAGPAPAATPAGQQGPPKPSTKLPPAEGTASVPGASAPIGLGVPYTSTPGGQTTSFSGGGTITDDNGSDVARWTVRGHADPELSWTFQPLVNGHYSVIFLLPVLPLSAPYTTLTNRFTLGFGSPVGAGALVDNIALTFDETLGQKGVPGHPAALAAAAQSGSAASGTGGLSRSVTVAATYDLVVALMLTLSFDLGGVETVGSVDFAGTFSLTGVPAPAGLAVLGVGLLGLGVARRHGGR